MTMADRNQVLLDFQECTNTENLEECIAILEQHDWNLLDAINSVTHLDTQALPSEQAATENVLGTGLDEHTGTSALQVAGQSIEAPPLYSAAFSMDSMASGSAAMGFGIPGVAAESSARMLNFTIEYRDRNLEVVVKDTDTIETIKTILEGELSISKSKQELRGWGNRRVFDYSVLRDLHLPKENTLYLLTPDVANPTVSRIRNNTNELTVTDITERLSKEFTLKITHKDLQKEYNLKFPGTKLVLEVKQSLYSITNVPVRKQVWTGWPADASDDTITLAGCGVKWPVHILEFYCKKEENSRPKYSAKDVADKMEIDSSSEEEFEDAQDFDDDILIDDTNSRTSRPEPLMPDNVEDELVATECFHKVFGERYGYMHPMFFLGSLDDAIKEALQVKAKERRLLAVYLHHDQSILANVFCSQILCTETIVNYLSSNFVTWAWDMTKDSNRDRLLTMCTRHFGSVATTTVRNFNPDELPLLLIITRTRSTNEVFQVLHASVSIDEMMSSLMHSVDVFQEQQNIDIQEEAEREARESVKSQQDTAYQESLEIDRKKEEAKRLEEEKTLREIREQQREREEAEQLKLQEDQEKEAISKSLAEILPDEPSQDCKEPISQIRIRCPGGDIINRRFLASHTLKVLLNFIVSKGFHLEEYKVLTTYPKRDVASLDECKTLQELQIYPQETLILEER